MYWFCIQIIITSKFVASFNIPPTNTKATFSFISQDFSSLINLLALFLIYSYYMKCFLWTCSSNHVFHHAWNSPSALTFCRWTFYVRDDNKKRNLLKLISFNFSISFSNNLQPLLNKLLTLLLWIVSMTHQHLYLDSKAG